MIKVIDYGMGNLGSIINILKKNRVHASLVRRPIDLDDATGIVLPGVGAFDHGITSLKKLDLIGAIENAVFEKKVPFLGLCLGMHLLFENSEEGRMPGLGWLKGNVTRFNFSELEKKSHLKIPHMGWNEVNPVSYDNLYAGLEKEARFYFVHSYHANCINSCDVLATTHYGYEFTCSVRRDNIWGSQFHPEKSHRFGLKFFANFLKEAGHAEN